MTSDFYSNCGIKGVKMKVKYRQSEGILSCYNSDYQLDIPAKVTKVEGIESAVLYDPVSCISPCF